MSITVSLAVFVLFEVVIFSIGWFISRAIYKRPSITPKPDPLICGCTHLAAFHDPKTGECHSDAKLITKVDSYGDPLKWLYQKCKCKQYTGAIPFGGFYAPEIETGE